MLGRVIRSAILAVLLGVSGATAQQATCDDPAVNSAYRTLGWYAILAWFAGNQEGVQLYTESRTWLLNCCIESSDSSSCLCHSPNVASPVTGTCG